MPYLFAHFKEKFTPDGEQVYFAVSRDGYNWEKINDGNPVLTAKLGEKGCRDIELVRLHTGGFVILTTDLCVADRYDENLKLDWSNINRTGSKCLRMWKTEDLVSFSEERLIHFGRDDFGCMWAPEVFLTKKMKNTLCIGAQIHLKIIMKSFQFTPVKQRTLKPFPSRSFSLQRKQVLLTRISENLTGYITCFIKIPCRQ